MLYNMPAVFQSQQIPQAFYADGYFVLQAIDFMNIVLYL